MNIDKTGWGPNLLAIAMKNRNDRIAFVYRGWRPAMVLLSLVAIIVFVSSKGSAGTGLWQSISMGFYIIIPLLIIGAILAFLYKHEIIFDFAARQVSGKRGFPLFMKISEIPFTDLEALTVEERGAFLFHNPTTERTEATHSGWDVKVEARQGLNFPSLAFWRAAREEQARQVAETMASLTGSPVKVKRRT